MSSVDLLNKTLYGFLLPVEGVDANDPDDHGGRTKYGISQAAYPDLDIANLTLPAATRLYRDDYWKKAGCDRLPDHFAVPVFDAAVQHGPRDAVRILQQTLGVKVDGINGPKTQAAAWDVLDWQWYLWDFIGRRGRYYAKLAINDPTQVKFLRTWNRRLARLSFFVAGIKR